MNNNLQGASNETMVISTHPLFRRFHTGRYLSYQQGRILYIPQYGGNCFSIIYRYCASSLNLMYLFHLSLYVHKMLLEMDAHTFLAILHMKIE